MQTVDWSCQSIHKVIPFCLFAFTRAEVVGCRQTMSEQNPDLLVDKGLDSIADALVYKSFDRLESCSILISNSQHRTSLAAAQLP